MSLRECILFILALPAFAGDGTSFGLLAGLNRSYGELHHNQYLGTNSCFGGHAGMEIEIPLSEKNDFRAQLVFHAFPGIRLDNVNQKNNYTNIQLAADWVHSFSMSKRHAYFLAGATLNRIHANDEGIFSNSTTQSGALGLRVGGGFAFAKNFRLEGHFNQVMVKRNGTEGLGFTPAQWLQISTIFHF